jgi:integrase
MARVKDLWWTTGERGPKRKTAKHPDKGGDPDAKRWLAVWVVEGRERSKAFRTKALADKHATDMQADIDRGEYLDPAAGRAPVEVLAAKWLRLRETSAATRQRYESCYRRHVAPAFGDRQAGGVRPSEVAAWSRAMSDHPVTRSLALMILSGIFDLAVADGIRRDNPARSKVVARPSQARTVAREREAWDADRIQAVARQCGNYRAMPLIAAGLGLREGELFGLAAEDIDEAAGVVHVRRQVVRTGAVIAAKLPKGGKTRDVPLPHGVAPLVRPGGTRHKPEPYTMPWLSEDGTIARKPVTFGLLFRWKDGDHIRAWEWHRYVWYPALAKAGVIPAYRGRNYPPARDHGMHALRHWYSTVLQDSGVSLAGVMEFMGHSRKSAPLSVGVYGHVTAATFQAARQTVDHVLFRPHLVPRTEQEQN